MKKKKRSHNGQYLLLENLIASQLVRVLRSGTFVISTLWFHLGLFCYFEDLMKIIQVQSTACSDSINAISAQYLSSDLNLKHKSHK